MVPAVAYATAMWRMKGGARFESSSRPPPSPPASRPSRAYALVLAALARASAASVAAVRETSVVIAALLAGRVLSERVGPVRLAGAVLVAAGVALVSLT